MILSTSHQNRFNLFKKTYRKLNLKVESKEPGSGHVHQHIILLSSLISQTQMYSITLFYHITMRMDSIFSENIQEIYLKDSKHVDIFRQSHCECIY